MELYQSGTYCNDIRCERMRPLVPLRGNEYLTMKNLNCRDCTAWNFFTWLEEKDWAIQKKPGAGKAALLQPGFETVNADELTEEEMTAIRSFFM